MDFQEPEQLDFTLTSGGNLEFKHYEIISGSKIDKYNLMVFEAAPVAGLLYACGNNGELRRLEYYRKFDFVDRNEGRQSERKQYVRMLGVEGLGKTFLNEMNAIKKFVVRRSENGKTQLTEEHYEWAGIEVFEKYSNGIFHKVISAPAPKLAKHHLWLKMRNEDLTLEWRVMIELKTLPTKTRDVDIKIKPHPSILRRIDSQREVFKFYMSKPSNEDDFFEVHLRQSVVRSDVFTFGLEAIVKTNTLPIVSNPKPSFVTHFLNKFRPKLESKSFAGTQHINNEPNFYNKAEFKAQDVANNTLAPTPQHAEPELDAKNGTPTTEKKKVNVKGWVPQVRINNVEKIAERTPFTATPLITPEHGVAIPELAKSEFPVKAIGDTKVCVMEKCGLYGDTLKGTPKIKLIEDKPSEFLRFEGVSPPVDPHHTTYRITCFEKGVLPLYFKYTEVATQTRYDKKIYGIKLPLTGDSVFNPKHLETDEQVLQIYTRRGRRYQLSFAVVYDMDPRHAYKKYIFSEANSLEQAAYKTEEFNKPEIYGWNFPESWTEFESYSPAGEPLFFVQNIGPYTLHKLGASGECLQSEFKSLKLIPKTSLDGKQSLEFMFDKDTPGIEDVNTTRTYALTAIRKRDNFKEYVKPVVENYVVYFKPASKPIIKLVGDETYVHIYCDETYKLSQMVKGCHQEKSVTENYELQGNVPGWLTSDSNLLRVTFVISDGMDAPPHGNLQNDFYNLSGIVLTPKPKIDANQK